MANLKGVGILFGNPNLVEMKLQDYAAQYGTDKLQHGYIPYYEKYLAGFSGKLLEIGIKDGASMRMWSAFMPNATLFGLDLFEEYPIPKDLPNVTFFKGNQLDHHWLSHIRDVIKPDVIIEDGSHNSADKWVTFFSLIGGCKTYIVEDLQTDLEPFYNQGLSFGATMLGMMQAGTFPYPFELYANKIAFIKNHLYAN